MKSLNIITVPGENGKMTGWLRDKPDVTVQGDNNTDVVKKLIEVYKTSAKEKTEKEKI